MLRIARRQRLILSVGLAIAAMVSVGVGCNGCDTPAGTPAHTWPEASWVPYDKQKSPFNWTIPPTVQTLPAADAEAMVQEFFVLSGCDSSVPAKQERCKPGNMVVSGSGDPGGGWPTYWVNKDDPEVTVECTSICPLGMTHNVRIPKGAKRQAGTDRHLTLIDKDGAFGFNKAGYEYDFYQVDQDTIDGGTIKVDSEGTADTVSGLGWADTTNGVTGNTNAAGFGNQAGRVRVEELKARSINHAITIAVPCVKDDFVYPAIHHAISDSCKPANHPANASADPLMGQLLYLPMTAAEIDTTPPTNAAPEWGRTILKAIATHGMYVNDSGGKDNAYFQIQTEAQRQYTSLGATDEWLAFAKSNGWDTFGNDYVGKIQGNNPPAGKTKQQWLDDWQQVWRKLRVVKPCAIVSNPNPAGCIP